MTLTEFLLARIAEDEEAAGRAGSFTPWSETFQNDNYGHLTVQPSRVLAECAALRRIVEEAQTSQASLESRRAPATDAINGHVIAQRRIVRILAEPYADHPDYREEWRP